MAGIRALMFEAYRRNDMADEHEKSKPLNQRWLGLGTKTDYKAVLDKGLMCWHDGKPPCIHCMGWLILTDKGVILFEKLSKDFERELENLKASSEYQKDYASKYSLIRFVQ